MKPMKLDYVVDTNILILFYAQKLKAPLPSARIGVSIITEIELLSYPQLSKADEKELEASLNLFVRIPLSQSVKEHTIRIRRTSGIKLPDAIICATAMAHDSVLLTNDKQLLNHSEVRSQNLSLN